MSLIKIRLNIVYRSLQKLNNETICGEFKPNCHK